MKRGRYLVLWGVFLLLTAVILSRLAYWQVVRAPDLTQAALAQRVSSLDIPATRGEIRSSDGFPLVTNQESYFLYANPQELAVAEPDKWAALGELLVTQVVQPDPDLVWAPLAHQLPLKVKQQVEALGLPGLGWEAEPSRLYPDASPSAHLLGFVGRNAQGLPQGYFGLEGYYDRQLSGKSGKLVQERDALNRPILLGQRHRIAPQDGRTLVTSIDRTLQFVIHQQLAAGLSRYGAISGSVTVMEPTSGRILAMVSLPNYDPSRYQDFDQQLFKNPVIADSYEPGSTFKVLVMAAALDSRVVTPDTRCDICSGPTVVADYLIRTWNDRYYPQSTMTEVIQHSDNVGMVYVGRQLGKARFVRYLRRFGLGEATGVDLQEENSPPLRAEDRWQDIDVATASFGQGIALTPLQMLRAVGAIANGGKLVTPHLVESIVSDNTQTVVSPPPPKRVVSPSTAATVTQMMVNSVERGEAKWAKPAGIEIAGKTGTAQIPVAGHYDQEKTIASFVGFAPAWAPKFVMLVTLREPQTSPWGSETAAPLWFDIAGQIWRLYNHY